MEELLAILIGAGVVALLPLVPGLRPVVKSAVKGGLLMAEATRDTAAAAGQRWREMASGASQQAKAVAGEVTLPASSAEAADEAGAGMTLDASTAT
jgi:hypothetical protein